MKLFFRLLSILLTLAGCSRQEAPFRIVTLSSGKHVKVLSVRKVHFTNDKPALMLTYETDIPMNERVRLASEVDVIWREFRKDAEKAGVTNAIIAASSPSDGSMINSRSMYNFVFQKNKNGEWERR